MPNSHAPASSASISGKLVEDLLPVWEERAAARRVSLAFARPRAGTAVMMGEGSRLARAIDNVVDNAISFAPPESLVEICASGIAGEASITVEDEGPGVPPDKREAIFSASTRSAPKARSSAATPGSALPLPRQSSKVTMDGSRLKTAATGGRGAASCSAFPGVV
jgi:two-component system sensor histidine kinase ChvG